MNAFFLNRQFCEFFISCEFDDAKSQNIFMYMLYHLKTAW